VISTLAAAGVVYVIKGKTRQLAIEAFKVPLHGLRSPSREHRTDAP
jgi:hypothetical protein